MVESEAKEWPRTHRLLVHASMSPNNQDYSYSGSRGYQQRSSVSNRCHFVPSSGDGVKQDRARYTGRLIERQASQGEQEVGGERFYSINRRYVYPASARDDCSRSVGPPVGSFRSQGVSQHRNSSPLCATSDSFARSE